MSIRKAIAPLWVQFRTAVEELVRSYNVIEEGKKHPAKTSQNGDMSITVSCDLGKDKDEFHTLSITITSAVLESKYTIKSTIERWRSAPRQALQPDGALEEIEFSVEADQENQWLVNQASPDRKFTAFQAAECVLLKALIEKSATTGLMEFWDHATLRSNI